MIPELFRWDGILTGIGSRARSRLFKSRLTFIHDLSFFQAHFKLMVKKSLVEIEGKRSFEEYLLISIWQYKLNSNQSTGIA